MKCPDKCGLDVPAMSGFLNTGSEFVGMQKTERGYSLRLYNITGDHKLAGSTVTVDTLVENNIPINDMTECEIRAEVLLVRSYLRDEEAV